MSDEMRQELTEIKAEMRDMRSGFAGLTAEVVKLRETDHRIAAAVVRLDSRVGRVEERLAETATKEDVSRIIGHIVSFGRDVEAAQRDRVSASDAYMRQQRQLEDHESRLSRLEVPKD
jgi:predicted nuclease with TOPRIM domain